MGLPYLWPCFHVSGTKPKGEEEEEEMGVLVWEEEGRPCIGPAHIGKEMKEEKGGREKRDKWVGKWLSWAWAWVRGKGKEDRCRAKKLIYA